MMLTETERTTLDDLNRKASIEMQVVSIGKFTDLVRDDPCELYALMIQEHASSLRRLLSEGWERR